ncbi:hypothetical protein RhiirA5_414919 [Rhizophagus irregularis]|uniref:Uncharacterized protein n=1 Tax=Rhizophagus irregularis TaxID=588596 RepID=A0A2N0PT27_9GLOM|nr:hypothetical protein RhiirA5_414919 [Rhizophagus irregularis]CAB5093501.1 unnamed protein product [Rhizophagus irregularis]
MPILKSTLRLIAPKPQTSVQDSDVIAVLIFTLSEIQKVIVLTTDALTPENKTGRETQVKWKWFHKLDALFGTRKNHNSGFLVDRFFDDVQ